MDSFTSAVVFDEGRTAINDIAAVIRAATKTEVPGSVSK